MSDNASSGNGNAASGNGAGNADINELINIAVSKRVKKAIEKQMESLRGDLASIVKDAMAGQKPAEKPQDGQAQTQLTGDSASEPVKTLKALQEKYEADIKSLKDQMAASNKARAEAEAKAHDTRVRSQVQAKLAAKLGADNPAVGLLMDSLYDVKKRFVEQDGRLGVKFASQYGDDDDIKTLDEGIESLFAKGGEYHHLVSQNRSQQLPPNPLNRHEPGPTRRVPQQGQQPNEYRNPLHDEVARAMQAAGNVDLANFIRQSSTAPNQPVASNLGSDSDK